MINLLKGEFYKLFRSCSFHVFCILSILIGAGMVGVLSMVNLTVDSLQETEIQLMEMLRNMNAMTSLEEIAKGNLFQTMIAIFACLFVVVEFTSGSMKQIVSKSFSRSQIYFAKLITVFAANTIFILIVYAFNFIAASIVWGIGDIPEEFFGKFIVFLCGLLVGNFSYTCLATMFCYLFRSNGLAIAINLVVIMFGETIFSLLGLLVGKPSELTKYWIISCSTQMSSFQLSKETVVMCMLSFLITAVICTSIGFASFQKRDI